jgi:cytochrome c biogenesis protein CcmG, thiol:disulfide interchange protein DsbE
MEDTGKTSIWRYLAPLLIFAVLVVFLYKGLSLNPRQLQSTLIDKPAPTFSLPSLTDPEKTINSADLKGEVWLLNVWASWCVSCRQEHPLLIQLAKQSALKIYGLNYKDERADALAWLARHGDPYIDSAIDAKGRTGMDYGVTGTPETFVIDKQGMVRYKYVGPLSVEVFTQQIWPLVQTLMVQ